MNSNQNYIEWVALQHWSNAPLRETGADLAS